jgi:ketosteroid isomerase-like protein
LYAAFAQGDLQAFLDGCTDDATFSVPGNTASSLRNPAALDEIRQLAVRRLGDHVSCGH